MLRESANGSLTATFYDIEVGELGSSLRFVAPCGTASPIRRHPASRPLTRGLQAEAITCDAPSSYLARGSFLGQSTILWNVEYNLGVNRERPCLGVFAFGGSMVSRQAMELEGHAAKLFSDLSNRHRS